MSPKVVALIPARMDSQRFPGKVLQNLNGLPLVIGVALRAKTCPLLDGVWIATGDEEVAQAAQNHGIPIAWTQRDLPSGTDRLAEANEKIGAEIIINVQGDEPLVDSQQLNQLVELLLEHPEAAASTLYHPLPPEEAQNPHAVKIVFDQQGKALYFSRQPLAQAPGQYFKHIGLYGYRRETLARFRSLPIAPTEQAERLEQLRLLHAGLTIVAGQSHQDTWSVDTPEDLHRVQQILSNKTSE